MVQHRADKRARLGVGMHRSLAFGGFSGTGKTTVGRGVAARTGVAFVDLDQVLEDRWGPIPAQFETFGEAEFRVRESRMLAHALEGAAPIVLATGGGTWVAAENRRLLATCWRVVLSASVAELRSRVGDSDPRRPLWDGAIEARLAARATAYAEADLQLDTTGRDADDLADEIAKWWSDADSGGRVGYQSAGRQSPA